MKPIVFIFDAIYLEGVNISKKSLKKRKTLIDKIRFKPPFFHIRGKKLISVKKNYASEVKNGHEGIVIKKLNSPYLIGKESPIATQWWRKIK